MTSLQSIIKEKIFYNENQTSYVEIKLIEISGTGGANDNKGYHFKSVQLHRQNTKSLRQSANFTFQGNEMDKADELFDSITDLKSAIKTIKSQEETR